MQALHLEALIQYFTKEKVLKVAGGSILGLVAAYLGKVWYSYRFFKRLGIKTPKYRFFWGNFPEIKANNNYSDVLQQWTREFGKTYGYYEGHLPILVTSDLEFIEEVFVKQHSNFSARKKAAIDRSDDDPHTSVFSATKGRWKRMRNIMNPTFSSSKLRELCPLMNKCTDRLIERLAQNVDGEINVTEFLKRYTMDTIWNCAFGIDADVQQKLENPYFEKSEEIFSQSINFNFPMYLGTYFFEIKSYILAYIVLLSLAKYTISKNNTLPFFWIRQEIMNVFYSRLSSPSDKKRDYMQLLIEARENKASKVESSENTQFSELHLEKKISDKVLNETFMIACYETTSTTLSYAFHILATHPEEQEKLINEIDDHFSNDSNEEPTLDSVQKLEYLDLFIKETLRMYPIGNPVITRRCMNPTTVKGIKIPVNLAIALDVLSVHYDRDLWGPEDPKEFHPLRFCSERKRHPMAFQGFGQGPRNCIGMKFALLEAKTALVKVLKNFRIEPASDTMKELEFMEGTVRSPKHGIKVILKKRNIME